VTHAQWPTASELDGANSRAAPRIPQAIKSLLNKVYPPNLPTPAVANDPPPAPPDVSELDVDSIERSEAVDYSPETDTYRASFDGNTESVSMAVVATVAVVTQTGPTELPTLNDVIDPEALDNLVERRDRSASASDVHVSFEYAGCTLTVHSYGIIAVRPPAVEQSGDERGAGSE